MATCVLITGPVLRPGTRFCLNAGEGLIEAVAILQDVLLKQKRLLGPAHPDKLKTERELSHVRAKLAAHTDTS